MPMSRYKPITVGEVLVEEFMQPVGLPQGALTEAMGVQRQQVNGYATTAPMLRR